ncbi:MAG: hypothetical protein M3P82_00835, partial [Bacteroidota bacterium]|nr:hypothetical protein [Bacteroidota bacterium]
MKNSLLTENQKKEIVTLIKAENYAKVISILEKIKTPHAGTAKTNDKRYVIREIVRFVSERSENYEKHFFNAGNFFCTRNEDVAKEIGVTIIWRGFKYKPGKVKDHLLKIADDANWEVRE